MASLNLGKATSSGGLSINVDRSKPGLVSYGNKTPMSSINFNPPKAAKAPAVDNSALNALNARLAALQAQLAYQPKLPTFDIMGNYNRARSQAEAAVNPLYEKYLRDFLAGQEIKKANKRGQIGLQKESTALELAQALAGNAVTRTRTGEDTAAAIEKLNIGEGEMQVDTGTQFDKDRRALAEQVAASGTTTSGVGQAQIFDQNNLRNLDESRQVKEYANQRQAKKLFESRTFEDLTRADKDATDVRVNKDKQADFDLEAYLQELSIDDTQFRNENEYKRLNDIASQSQTYAQAGVQQFLASLAGGGWRPQDIALAYQVYG